jgi:hypothetical protein
MASASVSTDGVALRSRAAARLFQFRCQLQLPQRVVPHLLEQVAHRAERVAPRAVEAVAVLGARGDEAGVCERAKVERDRAEGDVGHRLGDGAGRQLAVPDEAQDLSASRGRDRVEHGVRRGDGHPWS